MMSVNPEDNYYEGRQKALKNKEEAVKIGDAHGELTRSSPSFTGIDNTGTDGHEKDALSTVNGAVLGDEQVQSCLAGGIGD